MPRGQLHLHPEALTDFKEALGDLFPFVRLHFSRRITGNEEAVYTDSANVPKLAGQRVKVVCRINSKQPE